VLSVPPGGLAGSTLSLDAAVVIWWSMRGNGEDAIHMASLHPARLLGIDNQLGSLAPGKRANIIALDGLHLQQIWIQGQALPLALSLCSVGLTVPIVRPFLSLNFPFPLSITLFVLFLFFH
jgi:hypothetical protein